MKVVFLIIALFNIATSMRTALRSSNDKKQSAVCSNEEDSIDKDYETLTESSAGMGMIKRGLVDYCELEGTFVFYSEANYQVLLFLTIDGGH